ncbi:MAG: chromosomal replication initiator protein DnaA [Desulfobacterales bacterium]|nr:chromosomal replication initiator protein DnaA [Desulfobacterales bacterium]
MVCSWDKVKRKVRALIPDHCYRMWIDPVTVVESGPDHLTLSSPNAFTSKRLASAYLPMLQEEFSKIGQGDIRIRFRVQKAGQGNGAGAAVPVSKPEPKPVQKPLPGLGLRFDSGRYFKKGFTFGQFVTGENSEFAYCAARALARDTGGGSSVLYLAGKTGLGKSHLSQAVGHDVATHEPGKKVFYVTAEDFTNELVFSLKAGTVQGFKEKYRTGCDFLILEDVHFLSGKDATQKELAVTFDYLLDADKKIIFSGGMGADEIPKLNDRLRSRLSMGMVAGIGAPDFETRKGILRQKAQGLDAGVPDDVLEYIAGELSGDVRRLESGLFSVAAKGRLLGRPVDMALARSVLELIPKANNRPTAGQITDLVCGAFSVSRDEMVSRSRKRRIVRPRQLAMYLTRKYTDLPLKEIGKTFNRYHATVVYAVNSVEKEIRQQGQLCEQAGYLGKKIEANGIRSGRAA